MKKIKIIIHLFAVIAIVSTLLAFKVRGCVIYCDNGTANHFCNHQVTGFDLQDHNAGSEINKCVAVSQNAPCPSKIIFYCP